MNNKNLDLIYPRNEYPLYNKGINAYLSVNADLLNRIISHDQLSSTEKALLRVRVLLRDRKFADAENLCKSIQSHSDFLMGEKEFLLGNLFGFRSMWENASAHNLIARDYYGRCQDRRGLFLSNYNLSVDFDNLGSKILADQFFLIAEKLMHEPDERCMILRAKALQLIDKNLVNEALVTIKSVLELISTVPPSESNMSRSIAAQIYFMAGEYNESLIELSSLSKSKSLRDKARVVFDKALIERILKKNQPYEMLGPAPIEIVNAYEYHLKWQILSHLQTGDRFQADVLWTKLANEFPKIYEKDFKTFIPSENQLPFMVFINNLLNLSKPSCINLQSNPDTATSNLASRLKEILVNTGSPLRKELLVEYIWRVSYDPKFDQRLYKLIDRIRKTQGFNIVNKNQSYYLDRTTP
ncbi:MAG: hypothetical protein ACXVCY_12020 [Pseudobdellovibrionaceae bacterium]